MPTYRTLACRLFDAGIIVPEANILPPTLQMQDVCTRHIKDTVGKRCCQFRIWDVEVTWGFGQIARKWGIGEVAE
jgi:hypothetical protein